MFKLMLTAMILLIPLAGVCSEDAPSVEQMHAEVEATLGRFKQTLPYRERQELVRVDWVRHYKFPPSLREKYERWYQLAAEKRKWADAVELKEALLSLHSGSNGRQEAVRREADRISREIIEVLERYRREWHMINPALFQNFLINSKIKERGFCWHWVETFFAVLRPLEPRHFDLHWGVTYEDRLLENNGLVITRADADFMSGIAIDAWRGSGRLLWSYVAKDRHPWKKRNEAELILSDVDQDRP